MSRSDGKCFKMPFEPAWNNDDAKTCACHKERKKQIKKKNKNIVKEWIRINTYDKRKKNNEKNSKKMNKMKTNKKSKNYVKKKRIKKIH
jgi:hypothetical protein